MALSLASVPAAGESLGPAPFAARDGRDGTTELEKRPGCEGIDYRLHGRVADPEGSPIPHAFVQAYWNEGSARAGPAVTRSDDSGNYVLAVPYSTLHMLSGVLGMCGTVGPTYIEVDAYNEHGHSASSRLEVAKHLWLPALDLVIE